MSVAFNTVIRDTWNVVSPIRCAGCGRPDTVCCTACQRELCPRVHHPTLAIRRALFGVPVVAGTLYHGVVKRVLISYKEKGVVAVDRHLGRPFRAAVARLGIDVSLDGAVLVCVPHSRYGWVKRGRQPTRHLVKRAGLAGALAPARALRMSKMDRLVFADSNQKNRSRRERLSTPPTFVGGGELAGRRVILVDDVLTTGISLEYAARAIDLCGGMVIGAVVVAATPPRSTTASM